MAFLDRQWYGAARQLCYYVQQTTLLQSFGLWCQPYCAAAEVVTSEGSSA